MTPLTRLYSHPVPHYHPSIPPNLRSAQWLQEHSFLQVLVHGVPSLMSAQAAADSPQIADVPGIHVFRWDRSTRSRAWAGMSLGREREVRPETWLRSKCRSYRSLAWPGCVPRKQTLRKVYFFRMYGKAWFSQHLNLVIKTCHGPGATWIQTAPGANLHPTISFRRPQLPRPLGVGSAQPSIRDVLLHFIQPSHCKLSLFTYLAACFKNNLLYIRKNVIALNYPSAFSFPGSQLL